MFPSVYGVVSQQSSANWWEAGGATGAVAVYQPIGAASLAASYVNLANPGTYDAAPGVAPTWASAGWTSNGTEYLGYGSVSTTQFVRNSGIFSIFSRVKLTNYAADDAHVFTGTTLTLAERGYCFFYDNRQGSGKVNSLVLLMSGTGTVSVNGAIADNNSHVVGVVGNGPGTPVKIYVDGTATTTALNIATQPLSDTRAPRVLMSNFSSNILGLEGIMSAFGIWNTGLSDAQATAVSAAMAAL